MVGETTKRPCGEQSFVSDQKRDREHQERWETVPEALVTLLPARAKSTGRITDACKFEPRVWEESSNLRLEL